MSTSPEDSPVPQSPIDVARRLREAADQFLSRWSAVADSVTGAAARANRPALSRLPALPAAISAEQVQKVLDDLAARRAQVQALRDSLTSFDEQLALLETSLRPVLEWTRAYTELEKSVADLWRLPSGEDPQ